MAPKHVYGDESSTAVRGRGRWGCSGGCGAGDRVSGCGGDGWSVAGGCGGRAGDRPVARAGEGLGGPRARYGGSTAAAGRDLRGAGRGCRPRGAERESRSASDRRGDGRRARPGWPGVCDHQPVGRVRSCGSGAASCGHAGCRRHRDVLRGAGVSARKGAARVAAGAGEASGTAAAGWLRSASVPGDGVGAGGRRCGRMDGHESAAGSGRRGFARQVPRTAAGRACSRRTGRGAGRRTGCVQLCDAEPEVLPRRHPARSTADQPRRMGAADPRHGRQGAAPFPC